jgi:putative transposase
MALPRSKYVREGQEGVYHCFGRCVRRAFLCGIDPATERDFSHRKVWMVERMRHLASIFAIEVCAYAVMMNHYHLVVRICADIVALWTDPEVARRWLMLFPRHRDKSGTPIRPTEEEIRALADCPDRIAQLRRRLSSLSWFMGRLNEFIARAANKEDGVKGRFWESRFKCQALLDEAAIAACMVYVDLNPIRAGVAQTPEDSDFTSIQERIRAWQKERMMTDSAKQSAGADNSPSMPEDAAAITDAVFSGPDTVMTSLDETSFPARWLCPIQSGWGQRGILQMTAGEYFELVDRSGRLMRQGKSGAMDSDLAPILRRIGVNPDAWLETVTCFGSRFRLAAGVLAHLRHFADQLGRRWLQGTTAARAAFA